MIPRAIGRGWLLACALLALAASSQALAQTTITGTVTAPAGSSIEGVRVVAFDPATGKTFPGTVDAAGKFTLTVDPGTYTVAVVGRGFQTQFFQNVQAKEGQAVPQNATLAAATPVCIVKTSAVIPLTDDINAAAFADAPEILVNAGWNLVEGLDLLADWRGAATMGGRFRMKYDATNLYLAGDITFAKPNTNFGSDTELWKGNSLEILFQNDPYNPTRNALDPVHNFRAVIALTETPRWRFGNTLEQTPKVGGQDAKIADHVSVKNRADGTGTLIRANIPWAFFMTGETTPVAIQPPADDSLAAMDIRINNTLPAATAEQPGRQFQLSASGFGGTDPRGLIPVKFCTTAPQ